MSERNCGNCKHRGTEAIEAYWLSDGEATTTFYECQRVQHDAAYEYKAGGGAVVVDGSGYRAALCVEKTFCCAFHATSTSVRPERSGDREGG